MAARLYGGQEGAAGVERWIREDKEDRLPEFLKPRPKYHYYNQWMSERISAACGELPPPVVTKMLATNADDLDLMLQHPIAAASQVGAGPRDDRNLYSILSTMFVRHISGVQAQQCRWRWGVERLKQHTRCLLDV